MLFTSSATGYASSIWITSSCGYVRSNLAWRLPLALQAVLAAFLMLGLLAVPESATWLAYNQHGKEASQVLSCTRAQSEVSEEVRSLAKAAKADVSSGLD